MPLAAAAFCAYAAGLFLGFGGVLSWGSAASVLFALVVAARRRWNLVLLTMVIVGGGVVGDLTRLDDEVCARRIRAIGVATILLRTDLAPGRSARGTVVGPSCGVRVRIGVGAGLWRAGSSIRVRGVFAQRGNALDVRNAQVVQERAPGMLSQARAFTARRIDRLYGADAPL
ncbi:MAG: hypothetical protein Q8K82_22205, partial [Gemmatimonadaceae bacterium]|nr:hypothetical protein [Gemmatimonadaceae bacterium]